MKDKLRYAAFSAWHLACAAVIVWVLLLSGCATQRPATQLATAYGTVDAYVTVTRQALARGRITADQAERASAQAKKAQQALDIAATALASCEHSNVPPQSCNRYLTVLQNLQPTLLQLEAELRRQQKEGAQ